MKKMITIALITTALTGRSQSTAPGVSQNAQGMPYKIGPYTLTLKLTAMKIPAKAYLVHSFGWTDQRVLDSAIANKGIFAFKGTIDEPAKVQLVLDHTGHGPDGSSLKKADFLDLYLEGTNIMVKGKDSVKHAAVSGSALNAAYRQYHAFVLAPGDHLSDSIDRAYNTASDEQKKDPHLMTTIMDLFKKAMQQRDSLKYVYIQQHPDSWCSLEALKELAGATNSDITKIEPVFKTLSPSLRESKAARALANKLYDTGPTAIGAMAPDFTQQDVNGQPVRLSDFKGKYVLLDFWASWCGPCRAENPNVVKAYDKYKDKNFTVLSVSLDRPGNKDAWLNAIKKDGLTWTQVSDLQFWNNAAAKQYGITAIPQNFLIDPNGKIIAKNLRGDALEQKLEKVL